MPDEQSDLEKQITESLERFKNRPIYHELTLPILSQADDSDLELIIYDNICSKIGNDREREFEIVSQLSDGRRMLYATWCVEAEVNNGGFNQFYSNSTGEFANVAVWGFQLIGADVHADLMERANNTLRDLEVRLAKNAGGTLESFMQSYDKNPLNELDEEFYGLCRKENLSALRVRYIRHHLDQFVD